MPASWYPLAERDPQGTTGGNYIGGPARGVIHSNCGRTSSRPYYHIWFGGTSTAQIVQFRPFTKASKALRNLSGGTQTNRQGDFCINLCMAGGAAHPENRPLVVYEAVRQFMRWCENEFGIGNKFVDKPLLGNNCYGYNSPCRMTVAEWQAWDGWCEHKNVPENTHWDANITAEMQDALLGDTPIIELPPQPPTEDDMHLPLLYGDGYNDPPNDSVYAGQNRSHRREDVKYAQQIAGSGVDGYYGSNTSLDFAVVIGSGDGRTLAYSEWDILMDHRYGDGQVIVDHTHPIAAETGNMT